MTTRDRFDDVVGRWLVESGPADIRASAVDAALELAARRPQHRGLRARSARFGWASRPRRVAVVALAVLALAGAVVAAGALLLRPLPLGGGGWLTVSSGAAIHVLAPDAGGIRTIERDPEYCPRLSPDGTAIAYTLRFTGLYVTSLADERHTNVGRVNNFGYREGAWSPDRAHLAFRTDPGGRQEMLLISPYEKTTTTLLSTTDELVAEASWSPDSSRVAIAHARAGQVTVDIVDRSGVLHSTLGPYAWADEGLILAWSPNGGRIALGATLPQSGITIVDVATGGVAAIPEPAAATAWMEASAWSPDGAWLAAHGGDASLVFVRADGVASQAVPLGSSIAARIRWSPTDDLVAVATADGLVTVRAGESAGTLLLPLAAAPGSWDFAWSPDGSRLAVADLRDERSVVVTALDATGRNPAVPIASLAASALDTGNVCVSWDAVVDLD